MTDLSAAAKQAQMHHVACVKEHTAALQLFEAAVVRGDPVLIARATEACHAANQSIMDAYASLWAINKREFGLG